MKERFTFLIVAALIVLTGCTTQLPYRSDLYITGVKATASSSQDEAHDIKHMIGILRKRWIAKQKDNQWIKFEFEKPLDIEKIRINWENAFASSFSVELAEKEGEWKEVYKAVNLKKKPRKPIVLDKPFKAKFFRLNCYKRALVYGFSIFDITINDKELYASYKMVDDMSFHDKSLSPEKRAEIVLRQMNLDEKRAYTTGYKNFFITPLLRFGLREIYMTDASGGVHIRSQYPMKQSIAYPALIALTATWEPELAYRYASSISSECRGLGSDVLLGPGLNLYRNSMCGRSFEYMGEDPFLTGILCTEYVKGLQSNNIMATAKHYICNNNEWIRHTTNVQVDPRTLRELYNRPWYRIINQGKLAAIMGSYNSLNGEKACQNKELLTNLLRKEIGFKGIIMSDWGGVWDGNKAVASGLDLIMGEGSYKIPEDPAERKVLEKQLEENCRRILTMCFKFGYYDRPMRTLSYMKDYPKYEATALETARRSFTLLRNENNTLPLAPAKGTKILVTGNAKTPIGGGGSGNVKGYNHQTVLEEIEKIYGKENVKKVEKPTDDELKNASAVIATVRTDDGEHNDKPFALNRQSDINLLKRCAKLQPRTIVVLFSGRGLNMDGWGDKVGAILHSYYPGQSGAQAIAEIISGKVNPSGKLPFSIEYKFADSPAADYRPAGAGLSDQRKTAVDKSLPKMYDMPYKEGIFIGYRWYEKKNIPVRFPFGYGLSYTKFTFSKLNIDVNKTVGVKFELKNTGKVAGAEVAQVYFTSPNTVVERPVKELCAFKKVDLKSGEAKSVNIEIHPEDLAFYDVNRKLWVTPAGEYTIQIGSSSKDMHLKGTFKMEKEMTFKIPVPKK